ncbi:4783_t:CDS:1, partial [Dentiscutata heterogama]
MAENKSETLRILPINVDPKLCEDKNKKYYYFYLSTQPALKT